MKMLPWKTGNVGEKDHQKVGHVRKCHEKMMFYLFLGPLEGLKSRPSHHCLFSSDLAQPKKLCTQIQFLHAQTHWFWTPNILLILNQFASRCFAHLQNDLIRLRHQLVSDPCCYICFIAKSASKHQIPWMAAIFRKSDVKAKHLRRPARMTKYRQRG